MIALKDKPAFYRINHVESGHYYIGSTSNLKARMGTHKSYLKKGTHPNHKLQELYNRDNRLSIDYQYTVDVDKAKDIEQSELDKFVGTSLCCNIGSGSRSTWAKGKVSDDRRKLMSLAQLGRTHSEETRKKISDHHLHSPKTKLSSNKAIEVTSTPVSINGTIYPSMKEASRILKCSQSSISRRVHSTADKFKDWHLA